MCPEALSEPRMRCYRLEPNNKRLWDWNQQTMYFFQENQSELVLQICQPF